VRSKGGDQVVTNRNRIAVIQDAKGREKERYSNRLRRPRSRSRTASRSSRRPAVEWDPYTLPILTEVGGAVHFKDVIEGETMKEEFDGGDRLRAPVVSSRPTRRSSPKIASRTPKRQIAQE